MAPPAKSIAAAQAVSVSDLRKLWQEGQRGLAIREALESWQRLTSKPDDLDWLAQAFRSSGLPAEALAVQLEATKRQSRLPAWESLVRSVLSSGDPWWARRLLAEIAGDSRELEALRIETELALGDAAPFIAAWCRAHRDEPSLEAAVRWWIRCDRIDEAVRLVDETDGLASWRARLCLWRNRPDLARPLLATLAPDPEVRCLEAIAFVLEGDLGQGETILRELVDTPVRAEAWTWLTTVLRKKQRYKEALNAADAASGSSPEFNLIVWLERELASDYEQIGHGATSARSIDLGSLTRLTAFAKRRFGSLLLRRIGKLENARALYPLGLGPRDSIAVLETAFERFAGNHGCHLTTVEQGVLRAYPLPDNPRQLGSAVQLVLWTRGPEAARALYDELAPRVSHHPLYGIYHGELELWMGAYENAERIFRRILDRDERVRWAWIGLGASVMFQGGLRQAQKIWKRGLSLAGRTPGPTLYVYRGECYRRQGEVKLARKELETGLRQKPQRLSARINLALLDRDPEVLEQVENECAVFAPLLMSELKGSPADRLEQVLEAMRGNRSSSPSHMSYHLWGHLWRRGT
jgi:tetratricopeptide (TPR) repeat protein